MLSTIPNLWTQLRILRRSLVLLLWPKRVWLLLLRLLVFPLLVSRSPALDIMQAWSLFLGSYLSQLYQYNQLPVLIDPTAPNEVVTFDPLSSNLSPPAHPEVFSTLAPLPSSMHLEPLINVHRQRLIAGVIKSLVAGQHLASRVQFPIDKKLFHKCLRIRGLDDNTLQRAFGFDP